MTDAFQNHSDSDDDGDYIPQAEEESSLESGDEAESKRPRLESEGDLEEERKTRDALWASFQASVAAPSDQRREEQSKQKMVKIQRRYLFAGEYITEVVEVPEDSPDAKKWPLYNESSPKEDTIEPSTMSTADPSTLPKASPKAKNGLPDTVTPSDAPASASKSDPPTKAATKKPGPRKPKTVLQALPSASAQKAKKLTTLDKSLMDWKTHTQDSALQDELEANRRSGGYLEKLEFLQRVEGRKEENLETMKGRKRKWKLQ